MSVTYGVPRSVTKGLVFLIDPANPKSWIRTGTRLNDIASGHNHCNTSTVVFNADNSLRFNGTTSTANFGITTNTNDVFHTGGTVEAWINPEGHGVSASPRIIYKMNTSFQVGYALLLQGDSSNTIQFSFEHCFGTNLGEWTSDNPVVKYNQWQQVVATYSAAAAENVATLYHNGFVVASSTTDALAGSVTTNATIALQIGNNVGTTPARSYSGSIGVVRFYKKMLTAAEVQQNFNSLRGRYGL